jgi:serine/threonine protein kinase
MQVVHLPCAPFVNLSEERAFKAVEAALRRDAGNGIAYLLTNLSVAGARGQPSEIDQIVIAPGGAIVIEVKHWDRARLKNEAEADQHSALLIAKAKMVAGRLRGLCPDLPFVPATMLLTREEQSLRRNGALPSRPGVLFHGLRDVDAVLAPVLQGGLRPDILERLARSLAPREADLASQRPRRLARFDQLKLLSPEDDRFARVHAARDPSTGERVIVHSYDLSAAPAGVKDAENLARREFATVQRLQKLPFLPSLLDSWQAVPNYAGEIFFFTLVDPAATPIAELVKDASWTAADRARFAVRALRALADLHAADSNDAVALHRSLTPLAVRVRADNTPLFAGWRWARLPKAETIAGSDGRDAPDQFAAPEVRAHGLAAATPASDLYSLCATLMRCAEGGSDEAEWLRIALQQGMAEKPAARRTSAAIAAELEASLQPPAAQVAEKVPAPPQRWDEGHVFEWAQGRYRVVSLLGQGGIGRTFKLEQLDHATGEPIGTYVGKLVLDSAIGPAAVDAYRRVRPIADHPSLASILQVDKAWSPGTLMALLRWRRGEPLDAWRGADLQLLAELLGELDVETMLLRWAQQLSQALSVLHAQSWVHGDVSPGNILVDEGEVTLIDYDLAAPAGTVARSPGTVPYASPSRLAGEPMQPSNDIFSLAASLYHALTDRSPMGAGSTAPRWTDDERQRWLRLVAFIDAGLDPSQPLDSGAAAARFLQSQGLEQSAAPSETTGAAPAAVQRTPNQVPRLREILSAYPGSLFGNAETRGLDTDFAHDTYVETRLDAVLPEAIRAEQVSLVVLCGNAGDGKTAFLQRLCRVLGAPMLPSSDRTWQGRVNGLTIMVNLDGAAAWKGKSADALLDQLFAPFQAGPPADARCHLVAVNDGRLLEWIDSYEARHGETLLTRQLSDALEQDGGQLSSHIRLIELNLRSLVGGVDDTGGAVTSEFLDRLILRLIGGETAPAIWSPCRTCTAQPRCSAQASAAMMGASSNPDVLAAGSLFRRRLATALQAVHQRNEVHITARELKAAVSYILFGLDDCAAIHAAPEFVGHRQADFVFDPASPRRQGELLRELSRLDPALEAHARIDRYLIGRGPPDSAHGAPRFPEVPLARARRRAWFAWTDQQIEAVAGEKQGVALRGGRCFSEFRDFALLTERQRSACRDRLVEGLSRLDALPELAYRAQAVAVPLKILPRTPTETSFWVEKPLDRFSLEPERFDAPDGIETLHRHLKLTYRMTDGNQETLLVSLELFGLLLELADGGQILDEFSDDVFANLAVFAQRLSQEDERQLKAWNPSQAGTLFGVGVEYREGQQVIGLRPQESR